MIESVSLDQLRMFVAAADTGSFSAAARRLNRAQSAISQAIAALEASLDVSLFDRSGRLPKLTPEGSKLLATARGIVRDTDGLKAHARNLAGGLEPELGIVLDAMFPQSLLTMVARNFAAEFPQTPLRIYFEALGAVAQAVLDRRCGIGVIGPLQTLPPDLSREWLFGLPLVTVVAPSHPLASVKGVITPEVAERHVQIVLTDRSKLTAGQDFGVLGRQTWRVAELWTKHAFLCAGLGWGNMPYPSVADDIAAGRLATIELDGNPVAFELPMWAVYRSDSQPGLAGRRMIERLKSLSTETEALIASHTSSQVAAKSRSRRRRQHARQPAPRRRTKAT